MGSWGPKVLGKVLRLPVPLEKSMPGPSHLSNIQSKEDQTDLESSSISHYGIGNLSRGQVHCLIMRR